MVPSDRALATVSNNHVSVCSGLAAFFNKQFKAISSYISETVKDKAKDPRLLLITKRKSHTLFQMR